MSNHAGQWSRSLLPMVESSALMVGVLVLTPIRIDAQVARVQKGQTARLEAGAILRRAEEDEQRIHMGRIVISRETENIPATESWLRDQITDPRQLQVELEIAKSMPRRIVEKVTILFDNDRSQLLAEMTREHGQIAIQRALFTETSLKTYHKLLTAFRAGSQQAPLRYRYQHEAFIEKPIWPPYFPL